MKLSADSRNWRHFRRIASAITGLFLVMVIAFLVSYFRGRRTLVVDGRERAYHLHVPASYDEARPTPLLLVFHMRAGTAWLMQQVTRFNAIADEHGFIVVYPDGVQRSWADGSGRYEADKAGVDDVAFVDALLEELAADLTIDEERVYAAGFSNGGLFALRLGCTRPGRIAGVAAVSGVLAEDVAAQCDPEKPLPVLLMHGEADEDLPWAGKAGLASVPETEATWVALNDCDDTPAVTRRDEVADGTAVQRERYTGCDGSAEVVFYAIEGGGHKWPGGSSAWQFWLSGQRSQELDAGEVIWQFFAGAGE